MYIYIYTYNIYIYVYETKKQENQIVFDNHMDKSYCA